jgi:hypothetical protein
MQESDAQSTRFRQDALQNNRPVGETQRTEGESLHESRNTLRQGSSERNAKPTMIALHCLCIA